MADEVPDSGVHDMVMKLDPDPDRSEIIAGRALCGILALAWLVPAALAWQGIDALTWPFLLLIGIALFFAIAAIVLPARVVAFIARRVFGFWSRFPP